MKQIDGFSNYFITEQGLVWSSKTNKFLSPYKDKDGYLELRLGAGNKRKVHRLVASAYILNPDNKPQVNHKNGIKHDNRMENLEWVTPSENMKHSWDNGLNRFSAEGISRRNKFHTKIVLDLSNGIFYESVREASMFTNINYSTLRSSLNGNCKNKTSLIYAYPNTIKPVNVQRRALLLRR